MISTYFSDQDAVSVIFQYLQEFSEYSTSNVQKKTFDYVSEKLSRVAETI